MPDHTRHTHAAGDDHAAHDHSPVRRAHAHHGAASERQLFWALLLTGGCMAIEAVGGWLAGSLALLADAAHMLTDCASLALSYAAVRAASRPATATLTYGHHRWQVLAAFINGIALLLLAAWIVIEAVQRLHAGPMVQGNVLIGVATFGLLVNVAAFAVLSRGERTLNVRAALAHVAGDMVGSLAAVIAGAIILMTGWMRADPILSLFVALIMVRSGWQITRESAHILLEGAPAGYDETRIARELCAAVPAVSSIHHLHVWCLTDEQPMMTLHAVLCEGADRDAALRDIQDALRSHFGIAHATVQIELAPCANVDCSPNGTGT